MKPYPSITLADDITPAAPLSFTPGGGETTAETEWHIWNDNGGTHGDAVDLTGAYLKLVAYDGTRWVDYGEPALDQTEGRIKAIGSVNMTDYVTGSQPFGTGYRFMLPTIPPDAAVKVKAKFVMPGDVAADVQDLRVRLVWDDNAAPPVQVEGRVVSVAAVDLNVTTKTDLFTVPPGQTLIVTRVIVRNASTELDTASFSFGYGADADNVIGDAIHDELADATTYSLLTAETGAAIGTEGEVFGVKCSTAQGAAATADIDVFGYYI